MSTPRNVGIEYIQHIVTSLSTKIIGIQTTLDNILSTSLYPSSFTELYTKSPHTSNVSLTATIHNRKTDTLSQSKHPTPHGHSTTMLHLNSLIRDTKLHHSTRREINLASATLPIIYSTPIEFQFSPSSKNNNSNNNNKRFRQATLQLCLNYNVIYSQNSQHPAKVTSCS
jgi:hypothetical protein